MRVLYACHQFFPENYTGTERYTLELAKQMQRMGHHVCVLTYATKAVGVSPPSGREVVCRNYEYDSVPVVALQHANFGRRGGLQAVSFDILDFAIFHEVERLLEECTFDVLHCIHPMRVGAVLRAAKQQGLKMVLTLMDYWMLCPLGGILLRVDGNVCDGPDSGKNCAMHCYDNGMAESLMSRYRDAQDILAEADVILSHSRFLIDIFRRNGVDTSKFFHLSNGMDYSKAKFTHRQRDANGNTTINFGFLGTVLPHKGVHILVEAFTKVPFDNIRLKIYGGSFDMHEYYSGLVKSAKRDPRIDFCGEYDFNNVAEILESIDVVVIPSVWYENAPLVISTAQLFGIPVIATGIGGMAEMVKDGLNGFTFGIGDVDGLAEKIRMIATKPEILVELSRNKIPPPRIESEAFSLESLYAALMSNRHSLGFARSSVNAQEDKSKTEVTYSLAPSGGEDGEITISSNGVSIPVIASALQGHLGVRVVKDDRVEFVGWAADVRNLQLPKAIVIFAKGKFIYSGRTGVDRPDLVKAFGMALQRAGFRFVLPLGPFKDLSASEVRLFAVSTNGVASELHYYKGCKWDKKR